MTTRRDFLKQASLLGAGLTFSPFLIQASNSISANDKIQVALIGCNGMGFEDLKAFLRNPEVECIALCDIDENVLNNRAAETEKITGKKVKHLYKDWRKVIDNKDVDVVIVGTPDHWHCLQAVYACQAGKDAYCEKPLGNSIEECNIMVRAAEKYNRVVQVGAQRRSWPGLTEGIEALHNGVIGHIHFAKAWYTNNRKSIGFGKEVPVPSTIDFDLWQGPAPRRPYRDNLIHYNWHWFWHWGTGEALNNGTHEIDVVRWGLGLDFPTSVSSEGGRFRYKDDWETPDTQTIDIRFGDDCLVSWEGRSCNSRDTEGRDRGVIFYGEGGAMETGDNGYRIFDMKNKLIKEVKSKEVIDGRDPSSPSANLDMGHIADFIDAIKNNRRPNGDIEELHKSTLLVQLGNIAWRTGHRLMIDPSNGHIVNDPEAQRLWSRTYEPGWELNV